MMLRLRGLKVSLCKPFAMGNIMIIYNLRIGATILCDENGLPTGQTGSLGRIVHVRNATFWHQYTASL